MTSNNPLIDFSSFFNYLNENNRSRIMQQQNEKLNKKTDIDEIQAPQNFNNQTNENATSFPKVSQQQSNTDTTGGKYLHHGMPQQLIVYCPPVMIYTVDCRSSSYVGEMGNHIQPVQYMQYPVPQSIPNLPLQNITHPNMQIPENRAFSRVQGAEDVLPTIQPRPVQVVRPYRKESVGATDPSPETEIADEPLLARDVRNTTVPLAHDQNIPTPLGISQYNNVTTPVLENSRTNNRLKSMLFNILIVIVAILIIVAVIYAARSLLT